LRIPALVINCIFETFNVLFWATYLSSHDISAFSSVKRKQRYFMEYFMNFKLAMKCEDCKKVFRPVLAHRSLKKYLLLVFAKSLNKNLFSLSCGIHRIISEQNKSIY
jgi:hypothetical protein